MDRTRTLRRHWAGALALTIACATGCQTVRTPEEQIAKTDLPRELNMRNLPDYVVEPPDILQVEVLEALPGRPISLPDLLVSPDGTISLGFYGDVYVAGLTRSEIKEKIVLHLRKYLSDDTLGLRRPKDEPPDKPKPDPNAEQVIEWEEVKPVDSDRVYVNVVSYNSKVYYVQGDVGVPGRLPITGNERVLDAINYAGGLIPTASVNNIRLVRPAPPGACCEQKLPVNLPAIINGGDTTTNYQMMPGDRLVVYRDPIVRTTVFIDRLASPFNSVLNTIFQYSFTARGVKAIDQPINGTGTNTNTITRGSGAANGVTTPATSLNLGAGAR